MSSRLSEFASEQEQSRGIGNPTSRRGFGYAVQRNFWVCDYFLEPLGIGVISNPCDCHKSLGK
jgi:hypothetical protein